MDKLQRDILEALDKRKTDASTTNIHPIWQASGTAPAVFFYAWKNLLEEDFVTGEITNQSNEIIVGTGRITLRGEKELKALDQTVSTQELIDVVPDTIKERARKALSDFFRSVHEGMPCTLILTTDGESWSITDSSHPLPTRYLKEWEKDSNRFDVDLRLRD